jgi:hypothetical protein
MAALLAVLGALALWPRDETPVQQGLPASLSPAPVEAASAAPFNVAVPAPASPAQKPQAARTHWDLCDLGRVPVPPGAAADSPPPHLMSQAEATLVPRLTAALDALGPRGRAAARRLDTASPLEAGAVPPAWAEASGDPVVAAWATQGCGNDAACLATAARRWMRLEPDNLAPYLWVLGEARTVDAETLQRLAGTSAYRVHFGELAALVLRAWPSGEPRFLQAELLLRATSLDSMVMPAVQALVQHCRQGAADAAVREPCQDIARTLLRDSDTLLGVHLGLALGQAAGLPADLLAGVQARSRAAMEHLVAQTEPWADQPWSCASTEWHANWVADMRKHQGEWGALQQRLGAASAPR